MKNFIYFLLFLVTGFAVSACFFFFIYSKYLPDNQNIEISTKFSLINAPEESLKANIATMSGTVYWLSRTAKKPIKLISPRKIQQGEELYTGNKSFVGITINKLEAIYLVSNSNINFIQMLPINEVILQDKGTISYDNFSQNALSVVTQSLITSINNGAATISINPASNSVTVTVQKGALTDGYIDSEENSDALNIQAGQIIQYNLNSKTISVSGHPNQQSNNLPF